MLKTPATLLPDAFEANASINAETHSNAAPLTVTHLIRRASRVSGANAASVARAGSGPRVVSTGSQALIARSDTAPCQLRQRDNFGRSGGAR